MNPWSRKAQARLRNTTPTRTLWTGGLALCLLSLGCSSSPSRSPQGSSGLAAPPSAAPGNPEADPALDVGGSSPMPSEPTPSASSSPSPSPSPSPSASSQPSASPSPSGSTHGWVYRFEKGFCVDPYGNPGRNPLPCGVRDVRALGEVSSFLALHGGECLALRPSRPRDPAEILSGVIESRSLNGILAAHRGFHDFSLFLVMGNRGVFHGSRFHQTTIHSSFLEEAQFQDARFLKLQVALSSLAASNWRKAKLERARFVHSNLRKADFRQSGLRRVRFADSSLRLAQFEDADLSDQVTFTRSSLQGATFNCRTRLPFSKSEALRRGMIERPCIEPVLPIPTPIPIPTFQPIPPRPLAESRPVPAGI